MPTTQTRVKTSKKPSAAHPNLSSIDMSRIGVIILGGGAGTRLFPLTLHRCKPAITFGGRYRLVDIPISNAIHSGCNKLFIITQFLSSSLHQHIFRTYRHDIFSNGFIELLPAEQKPSQQEWFQGTADAVRQNQDYFLDTPVDYFLILSGDQLYTMNYQHLVRYALETDADLVIPSIKVHAGEAERMGILKISQDNRIIGFEEKPKEKQVLDKLCSYPGDPRPYLGSTGIYLFKRKALINLLEKDSREDFGKHLIPTMVKAGNTYTWLFDGYWEDVGTVASYYEANINLTKSNPDFNCYDDNWPLLSSRTALSGPKINNTVVRNSIICEGSVIDAAEITHTILGPRTLIKQGSIVEDSYIMGNEFYNPPMDNGRIPNNLFIDEDCVIRKAILDKHIHIGKGVKLINKHNLEHYNGEDIYIRDGIIIVPRGVSLPDGFTL